MPYVSKTKHVGPHISRGTDNLEKTLGTSDNQKRSHKAQTLTLTNLVFGRKSLRNSLKAVNLHLILIGFLNLKGIIDLL